MTSDHIRTNLKAKGSEQRLFLKGTFEKYGFKFKDRGKIHVAATLLLVNVTDEDDQLLTDHLWFNLTKGFRNLHILQKGDQISFYGRVKPYLKGYQGHVMGIPRSQTVDYKVNYPTRIKLEHPADNLERAPWPTTVEGEVCNLIYEMYADNYHQRGIGRPCDWL